MGIGFYVFSSILDVFLPNFSSRGRVNIIANKLKLMHWGSVGWNTMGF